MDFDENGNPIVKPTEEGKQPAAASTPEEVQAMVAKLVETQLAGIKEKLNGAYSARDEAVRKAAALEEVQKLANIKKLEDEGKHTEVANMKVSDLTGRLEAANNQIIQLTRDAAVRDAVSDIKFKNPRAAQMAQSDILSQLIRTEEGQWVHKTGVSIKDFVDQYVKDENNLFLIETKQTSGGGYSGSNTPGGFNTNSLAGKKMSDLSGAEMMALAAAGKLPKF